MVVDECEFADDKDELLLTGLTTGAIKSHDGCSGSLP